MIICHEVCFESENNSIVSTAVQLAMYSDLALLSFTTSAKGFRMQVYSEGVLVIQIRDTVRATQYARNCSP